MTGKTLAGCTGISILALLAAGPATAGEIELGIRLGETKAAIDADQLTDGVGRHDGLMNMALTGSYRWNTGALVEIGWSGSAMIFSGTDLGQDWIGAGWQFEPEGNWRITPRAGLTFSHLTARDNFFSENPRDERNDTVPYAELTVEYKFFRQLGLGLYTRYNFEEWGSSRSTGLNLSWTFLGKE